MPRQNFLLLSTKYEPWWNIAWLIICEVIYKTIIAFQWLQGNRYGVLARELTRVLFLTNRYSLGAANLTKIKEEKDFLKIYLKNYSTPVYYPQKLYLTMLYIVGENISPLSWHYYETDETPITSKDIVVDCGAGIGTFTVSAAKKAKRVYAIEPFNESLQFLYLAFKNNKKVEIIPQAVGSEVKRAYMTGNVFGASIGNSKTDVPISITTIDNLFYKRGIRITYLKADLEGFEMQMLKGAVRTIEKYRPKIAITVYHKKNDHIRIRSFLKKLNPGYRFSSRGIDWKHGNPIMLHVW